jgi:predicted ATP-dependent protease
MSSRKDTSPHAAVGGQAPPSFGDKHELTLDDIGFSITGDEMKLLDDGNERFGIIGQPRALAALQMAIEIEAKGYNVFATGMAGTGKRTAILKTLQEHRPARNKLRDIAYVFNFADPDSPQVLYFKPGDARVFRSRLHDTVMLIRGQVESLGKNETFKEERDQLLVQAADKENRAVLEFRQRLLNDGFAIVQGESEDEPEMTILPMIDGEPVSFEDLEQAVERGQLSEEELKHLRGTYYRYLEELREISDMMSRERSSVEADLDQLVSSTVKPELEVAVERMKERFPDEKIAGYLDAVRADILENVRFFLPDGPERDERGNPTAIRYEVNILVDHTDTRGAPIILESHPDYQKLFGAQETVVDGNGEPRTSFTLLRAGSLIQASGGFLVLRAEDVLSEEESWNSLKRALQDGKTEIRNHPSPLSAPTHSLKPEAVKIDVKIIIMGNENIYDFLYNQDEEFQKLFKVPAEFDYVMNRDASATREYINFTRMIVRDENLLPLDYEAIAAVVEFGVRMAESRAKLSTRFSQIADLIREAHYQARRSDSDRVSRRHVETALFQRQYLYNLPEEKIDEMILSGELIISVRETAIGRINGLAIIDRGYYSFARPMLITSRVAPGSDGIINIERESGLSGEIHDKGIYILEGFMQSTYARDFPLSIRASVCFEQSYVEVDGDSASSTEVYVLLSAIADIPLRQDIAVSGSVNQMGEIQAVGGISEKVEGFYEICKKTGLTGSQGVIIPRQNLANLILTKEVQDACREGTFHIYAVDTIDQGLEILTGMEAGRRTPKGPYKAGTVNARVEERLREMAYQVKQFNGD